MVNNRKQYNSMNQGQLIWREKEEEDRKDERGRMDKLARREKMERTFHRIKIISVLSFFIVLFLVDAYCVVSCLSYLNRAHVVTEVGHEIDISEYKPKVERYDTSWLFNREEDDIDWNRIGDYKVRFIPKLFGISHTLTISVVDTTPPEIILGEIGEDECFSSIDEAISRDFVVIDNYDGNITQNTKVDYFKKDGRNYSIFYTVKDSSGNETVMKQDVKIGNA